VSTPVRSIEKGRTCNAVAPVNDMTDRYEETSISGLVVNADTGFVARFADR
jgi:hypothetical protein